LRLGWQQQPEALVPAAFVAGAVYGLALYNFVAIAVDPDGSSRVTPKMVRDFISDLVRPPVITPAEGPVGVGGGEIGGVGIQSGRGFQVKVCDDSEGCRNGGLSFPGGADFGAINGLGSISATISFSFGGASW
jgi:peptidoglycan hydrolase-like protein with peptidoglycan-binding domain